MTKDASANSWAEGHGVRVPGGEEENHKREKKVKEGEDAMGLESRKHGPEGWPTGVKSSPDKT